MKKWVILCFFVYSGFQTLAQEKTFNYFIGVQAKYNNDITGKTGFFQYDNNMNYTNKNGMSYGINVQNGIYLNKWVALVNLGIHQKQMNQTISFFDIYTPIVFNEIQYKTPYFSSEFSVGRKMKISKENAIQLTLGYGIEKNLKSDFSGDFNNPNDAIIYYQYTAKVVDKVNGYLNFKFAFIMPFNQNELLFGFSLNTQIEEQISVDMENSVNIIHYHNNSIGYNRTALGVFLTYRFL